MKTLPKTYVRSDKKQLRVNQIMELFANGTFSNDSSDVFSETELDQMIDNICHGMELPIFGAREDETGNLHFKNAKVQQLCNSLKKFANVVVNTYQFNAMAEAICKLNAAGKLKIKEIHMLHFDDTESFMKNMRSADLKLINEAISYVTFYHVSPWHEQHKTLITSIPETW